MIACGVSFASYAQDCCSPRISIFEAPMGTPGDQCWAPLITGAGSAMADGGLWRITSTGSIYGYQRNTAPYLWSDGRSFETRMRVVSGGIGCCGIRSAAFINGADAIGRIVTLLIWDEGVGISTNQNIGPAPTFVSVETDTTSSLRTYRVETDAAGASLYIDDVLAVEVPYDNLHPSVRNTANFGTDSRLIAGSADTLWEYLVFSDIPLLCAADTNEDGILSPTDFTAWVAAFNASCGNCDQNNDGQCTPTDFTAWIANFNAGC